MTHWGYIDNNYAYGHNEVSILAAGRIVDSHRLIHMSLVVGWECLHHSLEETFA